ncbi:Hemicentin-2 [Eumeta japonica]|uniref:Hemicentin-2 n=1 Tax=Eumeta variegata TaxID=151549 RepID=A0A4C1W1E6_EUMVA|nr:Hemicentin-2 [Eumeta japonica]
MKRASPSQDISLYVTGHRGGAAIAPEMALVTNRRTSIRQRTLDEHISKNIPLWRSAAPRSLQTFFLRTTYVSAAITTTDYNVRKIAPGYYTDSTAHVRGARAGHSRWAISSRRSAHPGQSVLPNGNLVFPPFRAEDYRQEVHAQVYACLARNPVGTIHSRDVNVRAAVSQPYDTDVNKEYVISGNSVALKCQVPSFVADFVHVVSWLVDEAEEHFPTDEYGRSANLLVQQAYESEVNNEYVIRGNAAILKCSIPSFVADFVSVVSWQDDAGATYAADPQKQDAVVTQYYEAEVVSEYVIRGNAAVIKCNIPSFVADFVKVEAWVGSDGSEYLPTDDIVVNQFYEAEILTEYVIRGNSAVLKCSIPSFVADFVKVESWIDEEGTERKPSNDTVVSQSYSTEAENEYVIRGNAAIVRCKIPSFVSDFVQVEAWILDEEQIFTINNTRMGEVVSQPYEAEADNEYVIRGNAAIMKCEVPSFVSDFVLVELWTDSENGTYLPGGNEVVHQTYEARVNDEDVLRGNSAMLKCLIPSFVADYVQVIEWLSDSNESYPVSRLDSGDGENVVHQVYEPRVIDEDVLRGNSAMLKCLIPSFVADYVQVIEWLSDENESYPVSHLGTSDSDYVVSQAYTVNLMEENVLRGNAAIVKCHIPSFVTEYVTVSSWIVSEDDKIEAELHSNVSFNIVVSQSYTVNLWEENVLRGNSVVMKCHISSFVSEYVFVSSWIIAEGDQDVLEMKSDSQSDLVVAQSYAVNLWEEYVLRGNAAIVKCHIPSFVAEYVTVNSWIVSEGDKDELEINVDDPSNLVVSQSYAVNLMEEYVLRGNAAILKCHIPSFVAEFVTVTSWIVSEGSEELELKLESTSDVNDGKYLVLPSGELHIRDVGPEDGYKSYQCRTKHRLTGETRLSATKGRLVITEPVGRVPPKFAALIKGNIFEVREKDTYELQCPAQAFPVPLFRTNRAGASEVCHVRNGNHIRSTQERLLCIAMSCPGIPSSTFQPVGRVSPKFPTGDISRTFKVKTGDGVPLLCPAQGFPAPTFRASGSSPAQVSFYGQFAKLQCGVQLESYDHVSCASIPGSSIQNLLDLKRPPFLLITNYRRMSEKLDKASIYCVLPKASPSPYSEPIGLKAPSFSLEFKSTTLTKAAGYPLVLLCQAQAHPTPLFKFVVCILITSLIAEPTNNIPPRNDKVKKFEGGEIFSASRGDPAYLTCDVSAFPVPLFRWHKFIDGTTRKQPVVLNDRVKQVSGTLIIKEAKVEDSGKYLCVVNNSVGGESVETVLTVTAPLKATVEPATQTVDFGRPAVFTCRYEGNPVKTITWLKDGKDLNHHDSVLRIESVKKEDKGMYQCFIRNDQESAGASAELKLGGRFEPPQIRHSFGEQTLRSGPPLRLKCVASGNPTPDIAWQLDGEKLGSGERLQIGQFVTADGNVESHLNISSVHTNDGGLYTCLATSKVGSVSHSARINVYGLPYVRSMKKRPVVAGDTLVAHCPVAGYPIDSITWERDGRVLPISGKQKVFPNGTLVIENVERMSDQATYTCIAKNSQGYSARNTLELQVMVPPQISPFEFGEEPANAGDTVSVQCVMNKGDLPANFSWSLNGRAIEPRNTLGVGIGTLSRKMSILNIDSVNGTHRGVYTCRVNNAAGFVEHTSLLEVNVLPQIHPFSFGDEPANAGDAVGVQCMVTKGDAPVDIVWLLNGQPAKGTPGLTVSKIGHKASSLSIDSVTFLHKGVYTCSATNLAGHSNYSSELAVNVVPQINPFTFGDEPANAGDTVGAQCMVVKGDAPVNVTWLLNGRHAAQTPGVTVMSMGAKTSGLTIDSVTAAHRGVYTCLAQNAAGHSNHSAELAVNVAPQVSSFDFGEEVLNSGDTVSLTCTVTKGDSPLNIYWSFNAAPLTSSGGVYINRNGKRISVLSIDSIQHDHAGVYNCTAQNDAGYSSHSAVLKVNVGPQISPFEFGESAYNPGDTVSVTCTATKGDLPLELWWLFESVPLSTSADVLTSRTGRRISMLSIDSLRAEHRGNYTCVAKNDAGLAAHSSYLYVNVAPQIMPFDFGAEPTNDGELIVVICTVSKGDLPFDIQWYFNGGKLDPVGNGVLITNSKRTSQLTIESVNHRHQGNYTCVVKNSVAFVNHTAELFVNVPPQIIPFEFGEQPFNDQEMVLVTCAVAKGDMPLNIRWFFKEQEVHNNKNGVSLVNTKRSSQLSIESVSHQNQGNYTCVVANAAGATNHTAQLFVNVAPVIAPFEFDESVFFGEGVQVMCHVPKGDKPLRFKWRFFDEDAAFLPGVNIMNAGDRGSVLIIPSATAQHSGNYSCTASNTVANTSHHTILNVKVASIISPFEFDASVFYGESIQVMCHIPKGDTPLKLIWTFNDRPLLAKGGVTITKVGESSILTISSVTEKHSGNYTCTASNIIATTNHTSTLNVQVSPHIVPFEAEESVYAGESIQLQCHVSKGDVPLSITWSFHGRDLSSHEGISTMKVGERTSLLTIASATAEHSGQYTCSTTNRAGVTSHSASVNVNVAPYIVPFEADESVFAGESVQLNCHVSKGDLPLDIKWHFHGFNNDSSHLGIMTTKMTSRTSFLSVAAASATHSGIYTCVATNHAGFTNHSTILNVHVVPHIIPFEVEESVFAGESVHLTCHVSKGDRPLQIVWSFQGQEIPYHNTLGLTTTKLGEKASVLSIPTAMGHHSGNYTCTASNRAGRANHTAPVHVHVPPHIMPFEIEESVYYGESVQMTCHVSKGDKPLSIIWSLEGQEISNELGIKTMKMAEQTSFLSIPAVTGFHSGNYTCIAKNRAGVDRYTAVLHVKVIPHIKPFELDEAVFAGESVHLDCHVPKGDTPINITWIFRDEPIARNLGITTTTLGERVSVLDISAASGSHSGNYTCLAVNRAVSPVVQPFSFGEVALNAGQVVTTPCSVVEGDHPLQLQWLFNNEPIKPRSGVTVFNIGDRSVILSIPSVTHDHAGVYTCLAKNNAGVDSHSSVLIINVPPKIAPFVAGPEPSFLGDYFALQCIVTHGDLPVTIDWVFNQKSAKLIPGIRVNQADKRSSLLTIESVDERHAGVYNCSARNAAGLVFHAVHLTVNVPPTIVPFSFGAVPANPGDAAQVHCLAAKGDAPLDISWTFSSDTVDGAASLQRDISTVPLGPRASVLVIDSVTANHQGDYTCIVRNAAGRAEHAATLLVNGTFSLMGLTTTTENCTFTANSTLAPAVVALRV